jgi:hypothetical protein
MMGKSRPRTSFSLFSRDTVSADAAYPAVVCVISMQDLEAGTACWVGGQQSALLHPSPSVRETLADQDR